MGMNDVLLLTGTSNGWTVDDFLKGLGGAMQTWGALIVFVIGTAMVIASVWFIGKGLMSQGRGQTNWFVTILLLLIGGVFMATGSSGWDWLKKVADGANTTINDLGTGKYDSQKPSNPTIVIPQMKGMFF